MSENKKSDKLKIEIGLPRDEWISLLENLSDSGLTKIEDGLEAEKGVRSLLSDEEELSEIIRQEKNRREKK
jgi:hypothetical protein